MHIGRCAAAAEVCNLIEFVHRSAGFRQNRAAAGDKAPCIELAAVLDRDGAVIRHFDVSIITNGTSLPTTGSGKIPAAQADGAIDGNGRAFAHRQRPERLRRRSRPNRRRRIRIQRSRLIERDQQCNSSRNGIGTADRTIRSQGNLGLTVCLRIGNRIAQIVKRLAAGLKECCGIACKFCCNGAVAFNIQRCACGSCYALAGGQIVPAKELITICRGCHHRISGHGALRVAVFLCNEFSVYCISTVFSRHKGSSRRYIRDQRHIGHGNFCSCRAARLDINLDGTTRGKLPAEAAFCGNGSSSDHNRAAVLLNRVVKGKGCCCRLLIFNCQCGVMGCIAAGSGCAGNCTGNARTIGRPSIICVACKTQSNVLVG